MLYSALLLGAVAYKQIRYTKGIKSGGKSSNETLSIMWAWSSVANIIDFNPSLAKNDQLMIVANKHTNYLYSPLNLVAIFLIILYQLFPRGKFTGNYKQCIYTPNCSNYAIGILRRYTLPEAIPLIKERFQSCDGRGEHIEF